MSIIGKEKRTIFQLNDVPGPGNYNPSLDMSSIIVGQPKWSMHGTKSREIAKGNSIPGPGQYDPKIPQSQQSTIILARHEEKDKETLQKPGPDKYKTDISYLSKIAFSLGGSKRDFIYTKDVPGPGTYEQKIFNNIPSIKLGKEKREYKIMNTTVGPGAYNIPSTLRSDREFYIAPKRERAFSSFTPAPNAYAIYNNEKGRSFRIGTSKRDPIQEKSQSPGPCAYEPKLSETVTNGFSMGKSKRNTYSVHQGPGPGQYEPGKTFYAPKFSILGRHYERSHSLGPGPQAYNPNEFRETKNVIFGHSKRDGYKGNNLPGPGSYEPEPIKQQTTMSFGKQKRKFIETEEDNPGPGKYDLKSSFDKKGTHQ